MALGKGVFKPNRGNQFAPERDYQLFLEVFQEEVDQGGTKEKGSDGRSP